jgi:hypothetical protein
MRGGIGVRAVLALLAASALACVQLTPAESCQAICNEMQSCGFSIQGSSLAADGSCQTDCEARIVAGGDSCKTSAAYLADCFNTYTCSGDDVSCSTNASSFASDCH